MSLELWEHPTYLDVVRLRFETRDESGLVDPLYISSFSIWQSNRRIFSLGENPWIDGNGPLFRDAQGQFYFDWNPYQYGVREGGQYQIRWEYTLQEGVYNRRNNFTLEEAPTHNLPKESSEDLRRGDIVRLRFLIQDSRGNLVDPQTINRLIIYQNPRSDGSEDLENKIVFALKDSETNQIWSESGFLSQEKFPLQRDSEGQFYYDWDTSVSLFSPGSLIAVLYYRLDPSISMLKGNSWESFALELNFSPNLNLPLLSRTEFDNLLSRWVPNWMWDQPPLDNKEAVTRRVIKAFNSASKEIFDIATSFDRVYDPDAVDPRVLPSLASNIGWNLKGSRVEGWRAQIGKAVELYTQKGTLEGLRNHINIAGGRLESLIRYWQVTPRKTWTDYFVVDDELIRTATLPLSKNAVVYSEPEPYKYYRLFYRKTLLDSTNVQIRVVRNSNRIIGIGTQFTSIDISEGDVIKIQVGSYSPTWYNIRAVISDTEIELMEKYVGESSANADFRISKRDYEELDPETHLDAELHGTEVSRLRIDPKTDIDLSLLDEVKLQYQTGSMTTSEEQVESEILQLPLLDERDERKVQSPPKNFNSRIVEDPNGIWYHQEPTKEKADNIRVAGTIDNEAKILNKKPVSHANVLKVPDDYSFLPTGKQFVSAYGSFVKSGVLYKFAITGSGGDLSSNFWVSQTGHNIQSFKLLEDRLLVEQVGVIEKLWVTYIYLRGQFTPRDKTFLTERRDRLCPYGVPEKDFLTFGRERTIFPYSQQVYNMDEYNGSLRPSKDPCFIDDNFVDFCDCSPTSVIDLSITTPDLSDQTIKEFDEIIRESKPFHALVRSIAYVGQFSDSMIIQDSLEILGKTKFSDTLQFLTSPTRGRGIATNRDQFVFLDSLLEGTATLSSPEIVFYSSSSDFITAPANPNGILRITDGAVGDYTYGSSSLHELKITGLSNAPTTGTPQRFSLYNPISMVTTDESDSTGLLGSTIYGLSPYSGTLLRSDIEVGSNETIFNIPGIDLIGSFGLQVGDYIQKIGQTEFHKIIRIDRATDGKFSRVVINGEIGPSGIISLWRSPIQNQVGWFQENYNSLEIPGHGLDSSRKYVLSVGEVIEERGEKHSGPVPESRTGLYQGPIVTQNLFVDGPSSYLGSLSGPYSAYGQFEIDGDEFFFVLKGSGGTVGVDSDVYNASLISSQVTSIVLDEKGIWFDYSGGSPENLQVWYLWREGGFHPVISINGDELTLAGLNSPTSSNHSYELYEVIPTGVMFNPKRYEGPLLPPYSSYGSFENSGTTYYFVTKEEGGEVGVFSDIYPSGSGVTSIQLTSSSVEITPSTGSNLLAIEFAPYTKRSNIPEEYVTVKVVPDYPYFIKVDDQNLIGHSYRRIPSTSDVDTSEFSFGESLTVSIEENGSSKTRVLFKG